MIRLSVGFHRVFGFSPGLPVWSDHQVSLLQWFCQQGAGTFLQLWQWEVNPLPGGRYVKLGWPRATSLFLLRNLFCWTWQRFNLKLHSVSGLKPGQRKVLFCCFKRNDKREVKVAQLAGSVAEMSAYHHGEVRWYTESFTIMSFDDENWHLRSNSANSPDLITI